MLNMNIDSIKIWDEEFKGIGYEGLLTVNTKTYVESPTRANDGSMPNINDHDTFVVPRAKVNFKYFSLEDYQRLCRVINISNEFPVTYFDKAQGDFVTYNMYCEPEEMTKLFNVGTRILGVLDYEVSFIATLNKLPKITVNYYLNSSDTDSSILSTADYDWGRQMVVMTSDELTTLARDKGFSLPSGKHFEKWNTMRDGSGMSYLAKMGKANVFENLNLYAQWE